MRKKKSYILICVIIIVLAGCKKSNNDSINNDNAVNDNPIYNDNLANNGNLNNDDSNNNDSNNNDDSNDDGKTVVDGNIDENNGNREDGAMEDAFDGVVLKVDIGTRYQTIESFGTSGAWWSQYVGGWDNMYKDTGNSVRDEIAMLLYDREYGIGLTCYRYNMGAGSKESGKGTYWDPHRRASSFETEPFTYNWNRDANAVWFMKRVVELGATEVVLFCNSPLERLTINGTAQVTRGSNENILPENYGDFARYVMDVAEHFVGDGIPVRFVSPINEPQWDWFDGQEGCHYEPTRTAKLYKAFLEELNKRPLLEHVELSGPESGEWGGKAILYTSALLNDVTLSKHFKTIDNHSYWTDAAAKKAFKNWMDVHHPDVKIRTSEWCEMVNGSDVTMDSAYNLAKVLVEDLTILDVVSWQNWVGVAPGGYRDGLIYINQEKKTLNPLKRLWGYGNYTRFIRPGYTRVELSLDKQYNELMPVAFVGKNDSGVDELVIVFINKEKTSKRIKLDILDKLIYTRMDIYETSPDKNLENVMKDGVFDGVFEINGESITTVVVY